MKLLTLKQNKIANSIFVTQNKYNYLPKSQTILIIMTYSRGVSTHGNYDSSKYFGDFQNNNG